MSGRLAGAETCRNTKQQKSLCTSFFGSEKLMRYCLGMLYVQAASPTGKAEGFGTTEVEKDVFHVAKCKIKQEHRLCAMVSWEQIATQAGSTGTCWHWRYNVSHTGAWDPGAFSTLINKTAWEWPRVLVTQWKIPLLGNFYLHELKSCENLFA